MVRIIVLTLFFFLGGILGTGFCEAAVNTKIIINKQNNKLAFYQNNQLVKIFPVATGREPSYTPEGSFKIINKIINPYYIKLKIDGGAPDNPLGNRWMGLNAGGGTYGIHGNSNPASIGTYASGGCIRMSNNDVIWLYERIPIGTPVEIINYSMDFDNNLLDGERRDIIVKLNGEEVKLPRGAGPLIRSEQVFLPITVLAEQLGFQIQWDGPNSTLVLVNQTKQLFFIVDSKTYSLNLVKREAQFAPLIHNSYIYLPLYFFEDLLGAKINWDKINEGIAWLETDNLTNVGKPVPYPIGINVGTKNVALTDKQTPLLFGKHILVPVIALENLLGLELSWDESRVAVKIKHNEDILILPIESNNGSLNENDFTIYPQIVFNNGIAFVSVDDLARAFNLTSSFDYNTGILTINPQ
jgi:hypothetical protein